VDTTVNAALQSIIERNKNNADSFLSFSLASLFRTCHCIAYPFRLRPVDIHQYHPRVDSHPICSFGATATFPSNTVPRPLLILLDQPHATVVLIDLLDSSQHAALEYRPVRYRVALAPLFPTRFHCDPANKLIQAP